VQPSCHAPQGADQSNEENPVKKLMTIVALAATTAVISAPAFARQASNNNAEAYQQQQESQYNQGAPDWVVDHAKGPIGGR
jgi:hypothetical protein